MAGSDGDQTNLALKHGAMLADRYRIGRVLADSSSFALTYLAVDSAAADEAREAVVVKEFLPRVWVARARDGVTVQPHSPNAEREFTRALKRFLREGEALADISSPNLIHVHRTLEANGTGYLVMEQHESVPVPDILSDAGGRLPAAESVTLIVQLLGALERVHAEGIFHRAISPHSVAIMEGWQILLHGFASQRHVSGHPPEMVSGFAAFEQYASRDVGPWTDVYATTALLYYLITGVTPPAAVDRAAGKALTPAHTLVPGISPTLSLALSRGLALLPDQRPHGATELRKLLEGLTLDAPISPAAFFSKLAAERATEIVPSVADLVEDDVVDSSKPLQLVAGGRLVMPRDVGEVESFLQKVGKTADRVRRGIRAVRPGAEKESELEEEFALQEEAPETPLENLLVKEATPAPIELEPEITQTYLVPVVERHEAVSPLDRLSGATSAVEIEYEVATQEQRRARWRVVKYVAAAAASVMVVGSAYGLYVQRRNADLREQQFNEFLMGGAANPAGTDSSNRLVDANGTVQQAGASENAKATSKQATSTKGSSSSKASTSKESKPKESTPKKGASTKESSTGKSSSKASTKRDDDRSERDGNGTFSGWSSNAKSSETAMANAQRVSAIVAAEVTKRIAPIELVADLRSQLNNGKNEVEKGDYALGRRIYRAAMSGVDQAIDQYAESETLRSVRAELDQADRRALRACQAENDVTRKRGGTPVPCE